jgi:dynein heavy chain
MSAELDEMYSCFLKN